MKPAISPCSSGQDEDSDVDTTKFNFAKVSSANITPCPLRQSRRSSKFNGRARSTLRNSSKFSQYYDPFPGNAPLPGTMAGAGAATCPNCSKIKEMARIRLRKGGNKSRISIGSNKSDKSTQRTKLPKITQSSEIQLQVINRHSSTS